MESIVWSLFSVQCPSSSNPLPREAPAPSEPQKSKAEQVQRTVTTLMGGRGYIQWRATHLDKDRKASSLQQINNSDACLVIWDHKI